MRGIYLQGNEACREIFSSSGSHHFKDLGASTVTISNTGGTDHQESFDGGRFTGFPVYPGSY